MLKKINPFRKLDLVVHVQSGKRGIVTQVRGQMVTFEVMPVPPPGSGTKVMICSFKHLSLFMPAAMVVAGAKQIQKKENTPWRRFVRWWRRLWKRAPAAPAS